MKITNTESNTVMKFKGAIYGDAGVGKTSLAATFKPLGKGLIVSGEAGLKPLYGQGLDVFEFKGIDDLNLFVNSLVKGDLETYDWFFIDSITEIARLFEEKHKKLLQVKDQTTGLFDIPKAETFTYYRRIAESLTTFIRTVRNVDKHIFFSGLAKTTQDNETKQDIKRPMLAGQKGEQTFNGDMDFIFAYRLIANPENPKEVERVLFTQTFDGWTAKARVPMNNQSQLKAMIKNPNLAQIVKQALTTPKPKETK